MDKETIKNLREGFESAYINHNSVSNLAYKPSFEKYTLKPNSLQEKIVANLKNILEASENRALLISATGARVILLTGRKSLFYKGFEPVFSL